MSKNIAPGMPEAGSIFSETLLGWLVRIASPPRSGGGKRARTADPLLAKQVLSQLSYTPGRNQHTRWWA